MAFSSDVDECVNNAGMKKNVCSNGQCQNTMKDYICVCNAGFRSDVTKKLCNGKVLIVRVCFCLQCSLGQTRQETGWRQKERQIHRQTDSRTENQPANQPAKEKTHADTHTDKQQNRQLANQPASQTNRQTGAM